MQFALRILYAIVGWGLAPAVRYNITYSHCISANLILPAAGGGKPPPYHSPNVIHIISERKYLL